MRHILERHHPNFWNETVKSAQTFFDSRMTLSDIEDVISGILSQNRSRVTEIGANGIGSISGVVNGVRYQLGLNRSLIGQLFPTP
jgi:hypothetical protein